MKDSLTNMQGVIYFYLLTLVS